MFSGCDGNFLSVSEAVSSCVSQALCQRNRETALPLVRHSPAPVAMSTSALVHGFFQGHDPAVMKRLRCRRYNSQSITRPPDRQLLKAVHVCKERQLWGEARIRLHLDRRDWQQKSCPISEECAEMEYLFHTGAEMSTSPVDPTCQTALPQGLQDIQGPQQLKLCPAFAPHV